MSPPRKKHLSCTVEIKVWWIEMGINKSFGSFLILGFGRFDVGVRRTAVSAGERRHVLFSSASISSSGNILLFSQKRDAISPGCPGSAPIISVLDTLPGRPDAWTRLRGQSRRRSALSSSYTSGLLTAALRWAQPTWIHHLDHLA